VFYTVICSQETRRGLPKLLDYASCMVHLAVFGILGVIYMLNLSPWIFTYTDDDIIAALVLLWC